MSMPCVETETIAAFVDGTLAAAERSRLIVHLARCAACAQLVAEVEATSEELSAAQTAVAAPVPKPTHHRARPAIGQRVVIASGALALAASLLLIVYNRGSALDPLVDLVGNERLSLARPTGGFRYGPLRSPTRGIADGANLAILAEVERLSERAQRTGNADDAHAAGVGHLMAGDGAAAIPLLQAAAQARPDDATFQSDIGAAYLARYVERADLDDAGASASALDAAIALQPTLPEAWFNKALLFERLNRPTDALAAWSRYLELPDRPEWKREGERSRDALQRRQRS